MDACGVQSKQAEQVEQVLTSERLVICECLLQNLVSSSDNRV